MPKRRDKQTPNRCPLPLLSLLLVGLFLGHDMLMASEAVAHARQPVGAQHHATASHDPIERSAPDSPHPENCTISQPLVLRSTNDVPGVEAAFSGIVAIDVPATLAADPVRSFLWEEPHWPPGKWHAWFQVYRL